MNWKYLEGKTIQSVETDSESDANSIFADSLVLRFSDGTSVHIECDRPAESGMRLDAGQ